MALRMWQPACFCSVFRFPFSIALLSQYCISPVCNYSSGISFFNSQHSNNPKYLLYSKNNFYFAFVDKLRINFLFSPAIFFAANIHINPGVVCIFYNFIFIKITEQNKNYSRNCSGICFCKSLAQPGYLSADAYVSIGQ